MSGFFIGILAIMVGIGGGLVYNPLLVLGFGVNAKIASVISSFVIIFTSGSGFLKYRAANRIDFKTAKSFLLLAIPGAVVGAYIGSVIDVQMVKILFGIFIGASAIRGIYKALTKPHESLISEDIANEKGLEKRTIVDSDGDLIEYFINLKVSQPFAFFGGVVAGLLGVGGGIVFSPLMVALAGMPVHIAMATSASMISIVSIVALITKLIAFPNLEVATFDELGLYLLEYGVPLAIGAVIGARFGATHVKKVNSKQLLILFWSIALVSALRMSGIL